MSDATTTPLTPEQRFMLSLALLARKNAVLTEMKELAQELKEIEAEKAELARR